MTDVALSRPPTGAALNAVHVRADFPVLERRVHGKPLIYMDSAATALTPTPVLDAMQYYYTHCNANVHRAVHSMGEEATALFEKARESVRDFINAGGTREIVFTRGATEAVNLVAQSYARPKLGPGDEILVSQMEHHSNFVPWQLVCEQTGASLRVIPLTPEGELDMEQFEALLGPRVKLLALVHVSNALGTVNPVREMIERAHAREIPVLLDGAQGVPHGPVDVRALDCDFYAFSGHKLFGPTGIGALYAKESLLEAMPPYQGGGEMIRTVSLEKSTWNDLPHKFEAGTPNIAGAIGLGAAVEYVARIGTEAIAAYEQKLLALATERLLEVEGLRVIGTARHKAAVLSFVVDGVHPHDLGTILDHDGIAIRTGHHCAMPVMTYFKVPATARASLSFYNTTEEIEQLAQAVERAKGVLS